MKRYDWIRAAIACAVIVGGSVFAFTYHDHAFIADTSTSAASDNLPATRHLASAMLWHSRTRGCYLSVDLEEHETGFIDVPSGWCKTLPVNTKEGQ